MKGGWRYGCMKKKKKKKRGREGKKKKRKISWNYIFSYGNNLAINSLIAVFLVLLAILIIFYRQRLLLEQKQLKNMAPVSTVVDEFKIEKIKVDMGNWKKYSNLWYGFELQYPENWKKPTVQNSSVGADWEFRYLFRKKEPIENSCFEEKKSIAIADWQWKYLFYKKDAEENNPYAGFDVIIYDVEKVKELDNTDEFAAVKNEKLQDSVICDQIEIHLTENENYPAEKIYILSDDKCHNSVFFYNLIREQYIYNIVPVLKEASEVSMDLEKKAINNFPEFFSVASSFNLINIVRPKPVPPKPRITAPKPLAATKRDAQGRMVCAKKNDKPGKSNKGKSKHLDMECCLDPDEYPNPWCYYPPEKYGKYLK